MLNEINMFELFELYLLFFLTVQPEVSKLRQNRFIGQDVYMDKCCSNLPRTSVLWCSELEFQPNMMVRKISFAKVARTSYKFVYHVYPLSVDAVQACYHLGLTALKGTSICLRIHNLQGVVKLCFYFNNIGNGIPRTFLG